LKKKTSWSCRKDLIERKEGIAMPKYRTTPTELVENPDMINGGIEVSGVLFWLALLVDDEGRAILDSAALARRFNIEREVFERGLAYLVEHEFLQVYQVGRYHYYQILRWERWQNLSEKTKTPSRYPPPPQTDTINAHPGTAVGAPGTPGEPAQAPACPGEPGEAQGKRREAKQSKEKTSEVEEHAAPPPNVVPFPAARDDDDDPVSALSDQSAPIREATQQVASILHLPASEGLARIVADYLPSPGLSLVGEADAAREWVDDPMRNRKGQRMSLAFFRRWLQREVEAANIRKHSRASPGAASRTSSWSQARTGTTGAGPPAESGEESPDPYAAFVKRRAAEVRQRFQEGKKTHEATS
jgi:hypothetical protein